MAQDRPFEVGHDIHHATLDMITRATYGVGIEQTQLVNEIAQIRLEPETIPQPITAPIKFISPGLDPEVAGLTAVTEAFPFMFRSPLPSIHYWLYKTFSPTMRNAIANVERLRNRVIGASIQRLEGGYADWCAIDNMLKREDAMARREGRASNFYSQHIASEVSYMYFDLFETQPGTTVNQNCNIVNSISLSWPRNYLISTPMGSQIHHCKSSDPRKTPTRAIH